MNANDYIAALLAMSNYGKGKFKTIAKLIDDAAKEAVKLS
jgi:hypothetical protein